MDFDDFDDVDELDDVDDDAAWCASEEPEETPHMGNAWEFGTAAAVGGYFLDRQTERLEEALRRSAPPAQAPLPAAGPRRPAYLDLPDAKPFDWSAQPLTMGEVLERSRLAVTVGKHLGGELDLLALPISRSGRAHPGELLDWAALSFTISVSAQRPASAAVLLVFMTNPNGFTAERLAPVFTPLASGNATWSALDSAHHAVAVCEWALSRWHLRLDQFRRASLHT